MCVLCVVFVLSRYLSSWSSCCIHHHWHYGAHEISFSCLVNVGEDCPVFDGIFELCSISAGGSIGIGLEMHERQ